MGQRDQDHIYYLLVNILTYWQVFIYIAPEFETDPRMDGIDNIILSYTFFKIAEDK